MQKKSSKRSVMANSFLSILLNKYVLCLFLYFVLPGQHISNDQSYRDPGKKFHQKQGVPGNEKEAHLG